LDMENLVRGNGILISKCRIFLRKYVTVEFGRL